MFPDLRDDGLLPDIAFDGLNPKDELVDKVETAVSGGPNGETSAQDSRAEGQLKQVGRQENEETVVSRASNLVD